MWNLLVNQLFLYIYFRLIKHADKDTGKIIRLNILRPSNWNIFRVQIHIMLIPITLLIIQS